MSLLESAKDAVRSVALEAAHKGKDLLAEHSAVGGPAGPVTLTVATDPSTAREVWLDEERFSQLLGDVASVQIAPDRTATFTIAAPGGDVVLSTHLVDDSEGVRYVDSADTTSDVVEVRFVDAPHGLGTEVTLVLALPLPDVGARTAAFRILYRARALLQTGEIPTLAPLPSARRGNR